VSEDVTTKFGRRNEPEAFLRVERLELTAHFLCLSILVVTEAIASTLASTGAPVPRRKRLP
jgi:hypothetical protein